MSGSRIARIAGAFAIALLLLGQGISTPFVKDAEPQSAQWIVDIVQNQRWLLPLDYYGLVDRKPPLFYWLAAGIAEVTGGKVDETRARAVSLIAGAALAVLVLEWTAMKLSSAAGWLSFFFLIGSYGFASRATTALTDMLMSALLFATYCLLCPALETGMTRWRSIGAGLLLGFAFLAKGPVVLVLLGLATFGYLLLIRRNSFRILQERWLWIMLAIGLAFAACWYIPAFLAGRRNDLPGVFLAENFGHFLPASMGGTGEAARPVYYIALRLLGGALPLTLLLPALVIALARGEFSPAARTPIYFELAMVLAVLLFFSAASAKRDDYILPALPPLAILFAALFTALPAAQGDRSGWAASIRDFTCVAIVLIAVIAVLGGAMFARSTAVAGGLDARLQSSDASYAAIVRQELAHHSLPILLFEGAAMLGGFAVAVGYRRGSSGSIGFGLAAISVAGALVWNGSIRPIEARSRSQVSFAARVRTIVGSAPVYVAYFDPEFAWYFGSGAPPLPATIARMGPPPGEHVYFVARPPELARLTPTVRRSTRPILQSRLLGAAGPPGLYEIKSALPPPGLNSLTREAKP